MSKAIDITGQRFSRLVVVQRAGSTHDGTATWLCKCDCGAKKNISGRALRSGNTRSCGCLHDETSLRNLPKNPAAKPRPEKKVVNKPKPRKTLFTWCGIQHFSAPCKLAGRYSDSAR